MNNIASLILLAVSVGIFFININPQYKKLEHLRAENKVYRDTEESVKDLANIREKLNQAHAKLSPEDIDRLNKAIPSEVDLVWYASMLNEIGAKHGIKIAGVSATEGASSQEEQYYDEYYDETGMGMGTAQTVPTNYKTTTVSFSFDATYNNFMAFLKDLEKSLRVTDITSISLTAGEGKANTFNYTISAQIYSIK